MFDVPLIDAAEDMVLNDGDGIVGPQKLTDTQVFAAGMVTRVGVGDPV